MKRVEWTVHDALSSDLHIDDVVRVERTAYWSIMTLLAPLISPFATTAYILK